jgi:thymidylate synthase (FAD)
MFNLRNEKAILVMNSFLNLFRGKGSTTPKRYTEKDTFTGISGDVSRQVIEGEYCRVFIGKPRIVVLQTSRPLWDKKEIPSAFRELCGEFGHQIEPDAEPEEQVPVFAGRVCYQSFGDKAGRKTAEEYLQHIMEVGHYSVLEHSHVTMYIDRVPRFWSHEQVRHRHFNYSQLSQRFFVPDKVELVIPPALRGDKKIEEEFLSYGEKVGKEYASRLGDLYDNIGTDSFALKKKSREAARAILPECTETKMVITGNFRTWYEYLQKRHTAEADATFQEVAKLVSIQLQRISPNIFQQES